jgi:hypothetical protein
MNMKSTAKIILVITIISMILVVAGQILIYIPMLKHFSHWTHSFHMALGPLTNLARIGGWVIFLLAFIIRLYNPNPSIKPLFLLSACIIIFSTILTLAPIPMAAIQLFKYSPRLHFFSYITSNIFYILTGFSTGLFIFTQINNPQVARTSAAITLFGTVILVVLSILSIASLFVYNYLNNPNSLMNAGTIAMMIGHFAINITTILFFIAYLKNATKAAPTEQVSPEPAL